MHGTIYGTTLTGGEYGDGGANGPFYGGTVFRVSTTGSHYRVLHSFGKGDDGYCPYASLVDVNGILYGMTLSGGANQRGTVFSISTSGAKYRVLHSFGESSQDGASPFGTGLVDVNGKLYGTTTGGGVYGEGTIFSIDLGAGLETVLHSFGRGSDGSQPEGGLIAVKSTLYGTTSIGGAYHSSGTVFRINTAGTNYRVLHSFGKGSDGASPTFGASLADVGGALYDTTHGGGKGNSGTIFSISTTGVERVVYYFPDGIGPNGVIGMKGTLYGDTIRGGEGQGIVFSVNTAGAHYRVLHTFIIGGRDGTAPNANLVEVNGTLYGTTSCGGKYGADNCDSGETGGQGSVFELTP